MNKEKLYEYYEKSFSHIKPEGKQITSIEEIRTSYKQLLADLMECCPQSNNLLESLKLLENSLMYAVKSIVMNEEEKEPEKLPIIQANSITKINEICKKYGISKYYCIIEPLIKEDLEELLGLEGEYKVYLPCNIAGCEKPLVVSDIYKYLKDLLNGLEKPESKNISGETFTECKYTCDMCYKETDTITDIPGSQFKHGICDNCLDIVREVVEKGGII